MIKEIAEMTTYEARKEYALLQHIAIMTMTDAQWERMRELKKKLGIM